MSYLNIIPVAARAHGLATSRSDAGCHDLLRPDRKGLLLRAPLLAICAFGLVGLWNEAQALSGTTQSLNFLGPITGKTVNFSVYLPPGYGSSSVNYPVIYHLHGAGSTHDGTGNLVTTTGHYEEALNMGLIEPAIIVFPDGMKDETFSASYFADSYDGVRPVETQIVQELIPYVDANFRTVPIRELRAVQGYSMGGFGAARLAAKYPELFSICVIYDGALHTWTTMQNQQAGTVMFNNDENNYNLYSPYHWVTQQAGEIIGYGIPFRIVVGGMGGLLSQFRDHLTANGITPGYADYSSSCTHNLDCVMTNGGADSWELIDSVFSRTLTFAPADDAYVNQLFSDTNYGTSTVLNVMDAAKDRRTYLKFNVTGVTGMVVSTRLILKCATTQTGNTSVHAVADTSWAENSITWNSAPMVGTQLGSAANVTVGQSINLDFVSSSPVTGDGTYSFGVQTTSTALVQYHSKERTGTTDDPLLVVTFQ